MRIPLMLAAAAASLSLSASAAPLGAATNRVDVIGAQHKAMPISFFAFHGVQGEYMLDDGRILTISGRSAGKARTLYADFGDGPGELVSLGRNRYATTHGHLLLRFETAHSARGADTVHVSSPDGRPLALAQR